MTGEELGSLPPAPAPPWGNSRVAHLWTTAWTRCRRAVQSLPPLKPTQSWLSLYRVRAVSMVCRAPATLFPRGDPAKQHIAGRASDGDRAHARSVSFLPCPHSRRQRPWCHPAPSPLHYLPSLEQLLSLFPPHQTHTYFFGPHLAPLMGATPGSALRRGHFWLYTLEGLTPGSKFEKSLSPGDALETI